MSVDQSFDQQFDHLYSCAHQAAFRILGSRDNAEDIAQEAVARCLTRWSKVGDYAPAWVTRVASNLAIDEWRRKDRVGTVEWKDSLAGGTEFFDLRVDVVRSLLLLSRRQREVVVLRYLADFSEDETARALGCSTGSVKQHASRGLARLRRELGDAAPSLLDSTVQEG